jgi:DNA polymerase-1
MSDFGVQLNLFGPGDLGRNERQGAPTSARLVSSDEDFAQLLGEIESAERVAFDAETTGLDMTRCGLVGLSFCTRAGEGWYVPVDLGGGERWSLRVRSAQASQLRSVLAASRGLLAAHNAKFDLGVLRRHDLHIDRPVVDTLVAQFAVDPFLRGGLGLKALARRYFGWDMVEIETLIGARGHGQLSMRDVPLDLAAPYAAADADATWRLAAVLEPQVRALGLTRLLDEVEFPLLPVLVDMEMAGVAIDVPYLGQLSHELHARLRELEDAIHRHAGRIFNVGSPQQLSAVLYRMLGLHVHFADARAADDAVPSTRAYRLEALKDQHPIIPLVIEHRELSKLLSTYVDALPAMVNPDTGRVHTHFNQAVVITGRLSSSNPNLQNVPITTELGRRVRKAFVAHEGGRVISADYSQIELRVLAHLADDAGLQSAFASDEDIHATTAAAIYGVPLDAVTPDQRGFAKRVNYGIAYGMSSHSLARGTGKVALRGAMTGAEAERFMADYFKRFAGVKRWLEATKRKMAREGFVDTLYGRRRPFEPLAGKTLAEVRRAERLAVNHPVQGTAAEIVKLAMIQLHRRLKAGGYRTEMTLQVHDELVLDAPPEETADVRELLRREMEGAVALAVPLKAEVGVGQNWDEA